MSRKAADPVLQKLIEQLGIDDHLYWPFRFSKVSYAQIQRQLTNANSNWNIKLRSIQSKTGLHIVRIE